MAGLVRWIPARQILPGRSSPHNPENPLQDIPWVSPRATAAFAANLLRREKRGDDLPLFLGEIHGSARSRTLGSCPFSCSPARAQLWTTSRFPKDFHAFEPAPFTRCVLLGELEEPTAVVQVRSVLGAYVFKQSARVVHSCK